jgi:hypothetical protein
MSTQNIQAFFESAKINPELQQKISELRGASLPSIAEGLALLSQEANTPFTAEAFLAEAGPEAHAELSEETLETVSGGGTFNPYKAGELLRKWLGWEN